MKRETSIILNPMTAGDREEIMGIFNHYIEHTFAAFPEQPLPVAFFDRLLEMCRGYPTATARNASGEILGFAMLRPYNPMPVFSRSAEITYFVKPGFTGQGIGAAFLDHLIEEGKKKGLTTIIAEISSLNEGSIRFHLNHGFTECGRLNAVGCKKGTDFDIVYCQRML